MEITTNPLSLMEQINQLRDKLRPHLGWHGARLSFVALFLIALFRAKTVNLAPLASVCGGEVALESHYNGIIVINFLEASTLEQSGQKFGSNKYVVIFK